MSGVTTVDIGRAVSAIFEKGYKEVGETFWLSSDKLKLSEMAAIISEVSGKNVEYVSVEAQAFRDMGFPGAALIGCFSSHVTTMRNIVVYVIWTRYGHSFNLLPSRTGVRRMYHSCSKTEP